METRVLWTSSYVYLVVAYVGGSQRRGDLISRFAVAILSF